MVKFFIIRDDLYPDQILYLRGNCTVVSNDEGLSVFETSDKLYPKLKALEEAGFIKIIRDLNEINEPLDVLLCTEKVQMIRRGPVRLYVYILGHKLEFTDGELLGPTALMRGLLCLKKYIPISHKNWSLILDEWLSMAEDIEEISEEDEVNEKVLAYLQSCTIYTEKANAVGGSALFYDESDKNVVYSFNENISRLFDDKLSMKKLRGCLDDFLAGNSVQISIFGVKRRFWRFDIGKCEIDLKKRLYTEDEDDGGDNKN